MRGNVIPIPSKASVIAEVVSKTCITEAIKLPFYLYLPQLAPPVILGYGLYSWIKPTKVQIAPSKEGMMAVGALALVLAGAAYNYYRGRNSKPKRNQNSKISSNSASKK